MKQRPVCVSDFGDEVFRCYLTGVLVYAHEATIIGALIPGVNIRHIIARSEEAKEAYRKNVAAFYSNEANCNTCKKLERVKHEKNTAGFLFGKCSAEKTERMKNPYWKENEVIMKFHPDDPMHMPCYTPR